GYLRLLAGELGLGYHRLHTSAGADADEALAEAMKSPGLARPVRSRVDLRPALAALALCALLACRVRDWRASLRVTTRYRVSRRRNP
ncbi:MAG TPA: hypothetical protein VGQ91_11490, partial [Ideonella sp.]|nr:hypothetical protein [Ideonella sp.]